MAENVIIQTDLKELKLFCRGKVRDVYDLSDKLLIVSTDRISCFDVVLPNGIPYKGKVLTGMSCFWFDFLKGILPNHFLSADVSMYPPELIKYEAQLAGRSMLVKKSKALPVECIVRGYLSGSGWKEYQKNQSICGMKLPPGLQESAKLPEVIFTPSTKAEVGHDINVSPDYVERQLGRDISEQLKKFSIAIYKLAADWAWEKGLIIADTKFEFGIHEGKVILIDEVLTPDSSRFWPRDGFAPGRPQSSFDKQFVRDYLESLIWDKIPPAPSLPEEIVLKTSQKYLDAFKKLTGKNFPKN